MSNVIAFPITHPGDVVKPGEIDLLAQERMEAAREQIQAVSNSLIAILDRLAKVTTNSAGLLETANSNIPDEESWG
ncbi:hypothetical protein R1521_12210 [Rhizobium brockwellii]|uniref:Uncharacterized protein n=1 Tax=Rhizobium brockwellii TaxID=3019932 RepID=A0ABU3YKN6_9HYPH|nr:MULTISPECIES: hypothetical protein [Rhizobium]KPN22638.1 hypothetical protein KS05_32475 [Rhizobium brockwellii]MDV4179264.1 hypothetical protein [Rhizobium brockwellii]MDV4186426.1 hypothetical protein [Rhizobium brockwellii]NZD53308.1 hypothetical protein [Rhizobium leguminosarum]QJX08351.1 hypothetical protein RLCC275e_25475 [Rhizobium brockwellii]